MTDFTVGPSSPQDEPPTGWGVLLALLKGWGIALRLALLLSLALVAVVVIVALIVMNLGPVGTGALLTGGVGGSYSIARFVGRRRHHRTAKS
jgi:hypothetical protein